MLELVLFLAGFFILIKGANVLVNGASSIARVLGVSGWIIGLTILGIGTSIPEFSITLASHLFSKTEIGLGTIIGSNTFNILFIMGIAALVSPLAIQTRRASRQLLINIFSIFVVLFLSKNGINLIEGVILLVLFAAWFYYTTRTTKDGEQDPDEGKERGVRVFTLPVSVLMIIAGLVGVIIGAKWVLDGAVYFARVFQVSETLISLTLVAIGTSIPELTVSIVAAFRKSSSLAVGNIIGSNVFDFLGIIGFSALLRPVFISGHLFLNAIGTVIAAILLFLLITVGKRKILRRSEGAILVLLYLIYFGYLLLRT